MKNGNTFQTISCCQGCNVLLVASSTIRTNAQKHANTGITSSTLMLTFRHAHLRLEQLVDHRFRYGRNVGAARRLTHHAHRVRRVRVLEGARLARPLRITKIKQYVSSGNRNVHILLLIPRKRTTGSHMITSIQQTHEFFENDLEPC